MTDLAVPSSANGTPVVRVHSEPLTYRPDSRYSFYADLVRSTVLGDPDAKSRIARHQVETRDLEQRTPPNTSAGTGGEWAPPAWLIDRWAGPALAARVFADLLPTVPLPAGVSSVNIPKVTAGITTAVQPGQGAPVQSGDITSQANTSPVVTIAGELDVSVQLFEQTPATPGFDAVTFTGLTADYNAQLDQQLIAGTGINGQLLGLANFSIPAANTIDGSSGTSIQNLWPMFGKAAAVIGNSRKQPVEAILMAPRRWAWIASSLDNNQRPIASPSNEAHTSDEKEAGGRPPIGRIIGYKTYQAGAITAGTSADNAYFVRPSDMLLYESAARTLVAANPLSGTMQVRLRLHRYVAFVGNRFTGGLSVVVNIPQPSGF